jgi:hypothetical protein
MNKKNITCPISISKNNLSSALLALLEKSLNCPTYNDKNAVSRIIIRKVTIQYTLKKNFYPGSHSFNSISQYFIYILINKLPHTDHLVISFSNQSAT